MKTVIMAGGRGTRISELFPNIPKPLIQIEGVPVLEREIISLRNQGFKDIIMTVSHMGDKIMNHFGDGSKFGASIQSSTTMKLHRSETPVRFLSCESNLGMNRSYF